MTINQQGEQRRWAVAGKRALTSNHMTMTVGNDKRQERAADGDGSNKEGKDGKGNGDGNEGTG
jgi:hypothetical protein